jgi:enoyl-CoA hydratase/carnithine racemase
MIGADYGALRVEIDAGVAFATIDAPPLNLLGPALLGALDAFTRDAGADERVRVVVLRSADPDFFIAHGDVELLASLPEGPPQLEPEPNFVHQVLDRLRTLPKATIAQLDGMARGGGSEVALACDMRFAARGRAVLGQPEVALGILPGAGGTVRLARLVGRARAAEIILGGADFSADEAERYGWVNRALPADELAAFVERLARRIAGFPAAAIAGAKSVLAEIERATGEQLVAEQHAFARLFAGPDARPRMRRFLAQGSQTRPGERSLGADLEKLAD